MLTDPVVNSIFGPSTRGSESRSYDSKAWTSKRLSYWTKKGHAELSAPPSSKREAETSPSDSNTTEGFAVGTDDPVPLGSNDKRRKLLAGK